MFIQKETEKKRILPNIIVGDQIKLIYFLELPKVSLENETHEKIKERTQLFEGIVIAKRNKVKSQNEAYITIRKRVQNTAIEKTISLKSPWVKTIEIIRSGKKRQSKLYYLRLLKGNSAKLKNMP